MIDCKQKVRTRVVEYGAISSFGLYGKLTTCILN